MSYYYDFTYLVAEINTFFSFLNDFFKLCQERKCNRMKWTKGGLRENLFKSLNPSFSVKDINSISIPLLRFHAENLFVCFYFFLVYLNLSINQSIYLSVCLYIYPGYVSFYLVIHLSICLFVFPATFLAKYLFYIMISLSIVVNNDV